MECRGKMVLRQRRPLAALPSTAMDLRKVIFLGGNPRKLASVQIRAVDIAARLGCPCLADVHYAREVPEKYSVFVCVKPLFAPGQLQTLARRGKVVWDIIDTLPPKEDVAVYLTSTQTTKEIFAHYGRMAMIPHYHCNFEGTPNPPDLRRPAWIGYRQWLPPISGFDFDVYDVKNMTRADVVRAHRHIGIGLNLRGPGRPRASKHEQKNFATFHIGVNSGIKLINCLGFGIPSVSGHEPAYEEFGKNCTLYTTPRYCAKWVRELQNDEALYLTLRRHCLRQGAKFHIDAIAQKYKTLLHSL